MELFDRQLQAKQGLPWRGRVWVRCKDFAPRRSIQKQLCTVLQARLPWCLARKLW